MFNFWWLDKTLLDLPSMFRSNIHAPLPTAFVMREDISLTLCADFWGLSTSGSICILLDQGI